MLLKKVQYPISDELLHKKRLGKNTLRNIIIRGIDCTTGYSGEFYHYTSPEGLMGILKTRTLYFTDCQFLNDRNERVNINNELSRFWSNNAKYYDKQFVSLIKDIRVTMYEDYEYAYMESDRVYSKGTFCSRYFVLSASFDRDSLNMWKYYAKNSTYDGYCIGLATYALVDEWIDRETGVAIESGAVLYYSEDKQEAILKAVNKLYENWCIYKVSEAFNKKIQDDFTSWASIASLFFKDDCFAGEQEYRFIAIAPKDSLNELFYEYNGEKHKMYDFRLVNGCPTPFIRMPFNFWNVNDCWAINSIGVSPCLNADIKELGLKTYLDSLDYKMANCKIRRSNIPLRY